MNIKYKLLSRTNRAVLNHEVVRDPTQVAEFILTEHVLPCVGARLFFPSKGVLWRYPSERVEFVRFRVIDVDIHYGTVEELYSADGSHHECLGSVSAEVYAMEEDP